ncbi:type III-A CRISPR-associated protein Cas10/Csm1 [Candidatus Bathyarchaeota archaeon]|nr:type III-A CRISPR-associated protein Cas10/Csm1 [Candidatus Bathyarchaeota archaeon]
MDRKAVRDLVVLHHGGGIEPFLDRALAILQEANDLATLGDTPAGNSPEISSLSSIFSGIQVNGIGCPESYYHDVKPLSQGIRFSSRFKVSPRRHSGIVPKRKLLMNYPKKIDRVDAGVVDYEHLVEKFKKAILAIDASGKAYLDGILHCLKKFLTFIPSSLEFSNHDVSLYEHSKACAAIASCLHRFDQGGVLANASSGITRPFMVIMGDLSGIQDFIFHEVPGTDFTMHDFQAPQRLRGRSFLVNLVLDAAVQCLLDALDLYECNIVWQSGGNFLILAPNLPSTDDTLNKARHSINRFLLDTLGMLYMNLSWVEASKKEIQEFDLALSMIQEKISIKKIQQYSELIPDRFFDEYTFGGYGCRACGVQPVDEDELECKMCERLVKIGESLTGTDLVLCRDHRSRVDADFTFQFGDAFQVSYKIAPGNEGVDWEEVIDLNDFPTVPEKSHRNFKLVGNQAPLVYMKAVHFPKNEGMKEEEANREGQNEGRPSETTGDGGKDGSERQEMHTYYLPIDQPAIEFPEGSIIEEKEAVLPFSFIVDAKPDLESRRPMTFGGNPGKLAILKVDIDNLGIIFSTGFGCQSIDTMKDTTSRTSMSRISTLSFMIDMFFTLEINRLASRYNIYVIFAGGDDLTVVGRHDEIIAFSMALEDHFRLWVQEHPMIHISAGIAIITPNYPFRRAVELAEDALERSKRSGLETRDFNKMKHAVTIFDHTMKWREFFRQVQVADLFLYMHRENRLPSRLSNFLIDLHDKNPYTNKSLQGAQTIIVPIPYLYYYMLRKWRDPYRIRDFVSQFTDESTFKNIKVAVSIWCLDRKVFKQEGI